MNNEIRRIEGMLSQPSKEALSLARELARVWPIVTSPECMAHTIDEWLQRERQAETEALPTPTEFRSILTMAMVVDNRLSMRDAEVISPWLNRLSRKFGFTGWIDAYHKVER